MELTYEDFSRWFDAYFEDIRRNQGDLATVPRLKKFFAPDLELNMYTAPSPSSRKPMSRDALLISFVHPGLHEGIIPRYYAIDVKQKIVVVQFEIRFVDKPSGKEWAPIQASAHYHMVADERNCLKISRIHYWTEMLPEDLFGIWAERRDEAFAKHALGFINSEGT